jgi:asparagine synthase (glutamine-hydrolysing)
MCGFSGIVSKETNKSDRVRIMSSLIEHRGPDGEGNYNDALISLAFRRLAIIDLSKNAMQPMQYNNHTIVFNGEIYNYKKLRMKLEKKKYKFTSNSDTEVLLKGYLHWGPEILNKIKGMFALAIWDFEKEKLFIARDNFGKKPFYYANINEELIFCSEINPIQKVFSSKPKISNKSMINYLIKGYYNSGKTIYENIYTLNPGQYAYFYSKTNSLEKHTYWKSNFNINYQRINSELSIDKIERKIEKSIKRRFVSDVPVGLCLSGGVDSSLIGVKSSEISTQKIDAFTISFEEDNYDEYKFAEKVINKTNLSSIRINQSKSNLEEILNELVECFGEPFGDDSAIPSYTLFKNLKKHGKVFLSGDGADEVFGGYVDRKIFLIQDMYNNFIGLTNIFPDEVSKSLILSQRAYARRLGYIIQAFRKDNNLFSLLRSGGWSSFTYKRFKTNHNDEILRLFKDIEEDEQFNFKNLGENQITRYMNKNLERLSQQFLVKTDRTSMFNSVEVRSPFLDIDLFNYVRNASALNLFYNNKNKYYLKKILQKTMGNKFVNRKKMGFTPPINNWLIKDDNKKWIKSLLKDNKCIVNTLFDEEEIDGLLFNDKTIINNSTRIYRLLFLNQWFKKIYL